MWLLSLWNSPGKNTGEGNTPGYLSDQGIEPGSPALQADSLPSEPPGKPTCTLEVLDSGTAGVVKSRGRSCTKSGD